MSRLPTLSRLGTTALLLLLCFTGFSRAQTANEAAVKVAFLYNFFKFIEWPTSVASQNGYNLCITNPDDFGDSLQVLAGKSINGKPINLLRQVSDQELKNCHMLFIGMDENSSDYLRALKGLPIVTVSDKPDFINRQGMIGLIQDGNRLSFEINLITAEADNIYISAQLLKLAKNVNTNK